MSPATPFICNLIGVSNEPGPALRNALEFTSEDRYFVRPEELTLTISSQPGEGYLSAHVTDIEFSGPSTSVDLTTMGEIVSAVISGGALSSWLPAGQRVYFTIDPESILAFAVA